jgi:hypothetical protein
MTPAPARWVAATTLNKGDVASGVGKHLKRRSGVARCATQAKYGDVAGVPPHPMQILLQLR